MFCATFIFQTGSRACLKNHCLNTRRILSFLRIIHKYEFIIHSGFLENKSWGEFFSNSKIYYFVSNFFTVNHNLEAVKFSTVVFKKCPSCRASGKKDIDLTGSVISLRPVYFMLFSICLADPGRCGSTGSRRRFPGVCRSR